MTPTQIRKQKWDRSESGKISLIYHSQILSSKRRNMSPPNYTRDELSEWMYENNYKELYDNWVNSDYNTDLAPSPDRKDDYKPYTFDNLQLVTYLQNKENYHRNKKTGVTTKEGISILQIGKGDNIICEHHSSMAASRATGINQQNISGCCNGKRKSAGGFKWKFK